MEGGNRLWASRYYILLITVLLRVAALGEA